MCADDGHLVAVPFGHDGGGVHILTVPVGNKALQAADAHRLVLDAAGALALALALLRADTAALRELLQSRHHRLIIKYSWIIAIYCRYMAIDIPPKIQKDWLSHIA